jgi:hypothetical protein
MTPAAKLESAAKRLFWVWLALAGAASVVSATKFTLEGAAKRMHELEIENARLDRGLDGALDYIHQPTGSPLDAPLDTKGSLGDAAFDSQGSIQSDQD